MEGKIRLVIADDHNLFIQGLKLLLAAENDMEIADTADNGKLLLDLVRKTQPDLILLDINMPVMNGLEAIKYLKTEFACVKVIMLSTYHEDHLIEKAKASGANGYLLKNTNKQELLQTIRLVYQGQSCFPYRLPADHSLMNDEDNFLKQFNLTIREKELLQLIKEGFTNQQMADHLHRSIYTIETHRKNIMQKLKLKNPSELTKFLMLNNL